MKFKLYLGDCLDVMKEFEDSSIDCVLCDLPYDVTPLKWDKLIPFDKLWEHYNRIVKEDGAILLFGQEPFSSGLRMSNIFNYRQDLYWCKERPVNIMQLKTRHGKVIENISLFYKKQPTYNPQMVKYDGKPVKTVPKDGVISVLSGSKRKKVKPYNDTGWRYPTQLLKFNRDCIHGISYHPTQKPVDLLEYLIRTFTNEGDVILDNCMGGGSTGVACLNTNRYFIGIEKDEKYFKIAEERILKHGDHTEVTERSN
jgi:site-specific DNA-methyltransferase (adenine-specific)